METRKQIVVSEYNIKDVDDYKKKFIEKNKEIIAVPCKIYRENESTHICPYGCGRQVPNEFKGCTELLQARPNYYG